MNRGLMDLEMLSSRPDDHCSAGLGQEMAQSGWTMSVVLVQN